MNIDLPSFRSAKQLAKELRNSQAAEGNKLTHSQALELIAHQFGFRDWNSFHAAIGKAASESWSPGARVSGSYLSQPFEATIRAVDRSQAGWMRLDLEFDEAVDVVTFSRFSNLRKRVQATVGPDGYSREKTSDGKPQMFLDM